MRSRKELGASSSGFLETSLVGAARCWSTFPCLGDRRLQADIARGPAIETGTVARVLLHGRLSQRRVDSRAFPARAECDFVLRVSETFDYRFVWAHIGLVAGKDGSVSVAALL